MNHVNLVPVDRLRSSSRRRRRNAWAVAVALGAVCAVIPGIARLRTERAVALLHAKLTEVLSQQIDLNRRLTAARGERTDRAEELKGLLALRRRTDWSGWLAHLSERAPEGVVLTEFLADPSVQLAVRARNSALGGRTQKPADGNNTAVIARLAGFAQDHEELAKLMKALENVPDCGGVELTNATRQPYRNGFAVAFQLECQIGGSER